MDRKDLAVFGVGIAIVIIVALIGKPLLTGESIPFLSSSEPSVNHSGPLPIPEDLSEINPAITKTTTPTPTPVWDGEVKTVGYVDPSTYNIETPEQPVIGPQPTAYQQNREMTSYAVIQGEASGVTEMVNVPYGYWEVHITFNPWTDNPINSYLEVQIRNAEDRSDYQAFSSVDEAPRPIRDSDAKVWVIEQYGAGNYYFVINEQLLKSYTIKIMVPKSES
ncbi:hypothetical protein [Methanogenium organophilum]|uniref:Uncharacterized protein n=1 Tax=Methanogenium organophilum TaxID=2199 RepID=A0A9X9S361_METOG|nr:hypothetical protein [Methanogenium organophilum]WAI01049.1 hypothetical protein OU421_11600 [Methanogenium organophilum]